MNKDYAHSMHDDAISRQAAIDALERIFDRCEEIEAHFPDDDSDNLKLVVAIRQRLW